MVFMPPPMPCQVSHCAWTFEVIKPAARAVAMAPVAMDDCSGRLALGHAARQNPGKRGEASRAINDAMCSFMACSLSVMSSDANGPFPAIGKREGCRVRQCPRHGKRRITRGLARFLDVFLNLFRRES